MATRYDIISDTHGYLSPELLEQLQGADVIVHAGDICSPSDYRTLSDIARVQMCLGNNDWSYDYGPMVKDRSSATRSTSSSTTIAGWCARAILAAAWMCWSAPPLSRTAVVPGVLLSR